MQLNISVIINGETKHLSLDGRCVLVLMDANLLTSVSQSTPSVNVMEVSVQPGAQCLYLIALDIQQDNSHLSQMTGFDERVCQPDG